MTLYLWQRERRSRTASRPADAGVRGAPSEPPPTAPGLDPARRAFRAACLARDPRTARTALIDWARARWPDQNPAGLEALAARFDDPEVHTILRAIDRAIYAPPSEIWDGETAWKRLEPHLGADRANTPDHASPIPELYPRT